MRCAVASASLLAVAFVGSAGMGQEEKPKTDSKAESKEDLPSLKKTKKKAGKVTLFGYEGRKEVQEKLKYTDDDRTKIGDLQKWRRDEEARIEAEYEKKLQGVLGADRWKQLVDFVEAERKESEDKKKSTKTPPAKTETKAETKPGTK